MNKDQLHIYDWVSFRRVPVRVLAISGIYVDIEIGNEMLRVEPEELSGVTLTRDSLLDNAFADVEDAQLIYDGSKENGMFAVLEESYGNYSAKLISNTSRYEGKIYHWHTLQDLLRLFGESDFANNIRL